MINIRSSILFLIFLTCPFLSYAEESKYDQEYLKMVEKALETPDNYDFRKLRDLYTKSSFYKPYQKNPKADMKNLIDKAKSGNEKAHEEFNKYFIESFVYFDTHVWYPVAVLGQKMKGLYPSKISSWAASHLIDILIEENGNGLSAKTPFNVISVSEEYTIIKMLKAKYDFHDRQILKAKDRIFDVWNVTDRATEKKIKIFFDITIPFKKVDS